MGYCSFRDRTWRIRVEVSCFRHPKEIQQKSRSRDSSQNEKGGGIARVNDDETGQRRAKRRTNTLRGYHGALGQIEMAGTAG